MLPVRGQSLSSCHSCSVMFKILYHADRCDSLLRIVMGQRANLKFCFKMCRTATETFQLIKEAYGENTVSHT
jgi:hypothetical protein